MDKKEDFIKKKIKIMERGVYLYTPLFSSAFLFAIFDILQRRAYYKFYILVPILIYTIGYKVIYISNIMIKLINQIIENIQITNDLIIIDTYGGLWCKSKRYRLYFGEILVAENTSLHQMTDINMFMKYILKTKYNNKDIELFLSEEMYKKLITKNEN